MTVRADQFKLYRQFDVIPLRKLGKNPRDMDWPNRSYDAARVIEHCRLHDCNIGWRLGPADLVIDIDPRNGGSLEALAKYFRIDVSLFPRVDTGSGGFHLYARKPADLAIVETIEALPGVEFKSKGRQMVCAGSIHPETKKHYIWNSESPPLNKRPDCPDAILAAITRPERSNEATEGGQYTPEQIAHALAALDVTAFRDHDKWLQLLMACHAASNGEARAEFVEWSIKDSDYAEHAETIGNRWDSLHANKPDGVTYRTLNHILAEHGAANAQAPADASGDFEAVPDNVASIVPAEPSGFKVNKGNAAPDTLHNALVAVAKIRLDPAWDELRQNVVFRGELPWPEGHGRILTDHTLRLARIFLLSRFQGIDYQPGADHLFNALSGAAFARKFNPVLEYIDSLQWDGVARVDRLFPDYFRCGDDAYTRAVSRCFMVGAVRRMRRPGCKFDTMPILKSPQGWNKSTALKTLFGADWYSDAELGNLRDKDTVLKLRGIWVQEFAEIESLTRAEVGVLKAFLSRATDRQRDPYNRVAEDQPRRCVFAATVNEGGYLKDSTGGRRFWPLDVAGIIDVAKIAKDRDQLWAEAALLEAEGAPDMLPAELWPVAAERQAEQTTDDPWADTLAEFLERRAWDYATHDAASDDVPPLPPDRVHTSELFAALKIGDDARTKDRAQRLRTVMESVLGWRHMRSGVRVFGSTGKGYVRLEKGSVD